MRTYVLCYVLYALLLALSYGVFVIWSQTILLALGVFDDQQQATPALWGVGMLVVGIGLYLFVLVAEPYLRGGVPKRQLGARFLRIAGPLVVTIVVGVVAQELIRALA
jgi:UDP-N-acetylmuramyl pentapeptide phosphotransferase/UDP-N-acetylglucosamine-1-phosphate transferase